MNILLVFLLVSTLVTAPVPLPSAQTTAFRGSAFPLTVQLRGQSGMPIDNATVLFFHETRNELLGSAVTNSTGFARFIWIIPLDHELGSVQLNATFRGDPERYLLPSMVPISLTIYAQLQSYINVVDVFNNSLESVVQAGQRLYFHTQILDDNSTPVEGITVQLIQEPNQILTQKITPQNGSVIFSCLLNRTLNSQITFTIRSLDYEYYNGTERTFTLFLTETLTRFNGLPLYWHVSLGYALQGTLRTFSDQDIPNASIELQFESGELLKVTQTDNHGNFQFNLFDIIGLIQYNRYFVIYYNGSSGYSEAKATIRIIPSSPLDPLIQILQPFFLLLENPIIRHISIVSFGCLAIGTSLLTRKMKRSTKRLVSH